MIINHTGPDMREPNPNMDTDPDFPRMFYRYPGISRDASKLQDGSYDTLVVSDADEAATALADSWFATSPEARAAGEEAIAAAKGVAQAASDAKALEDAKALIAASANSLKPATREELEAKATELELKFDGRTSDKKLADLISATLES